MEGIDFGVESLEFIDINYVFCLIKIVVFFSSFFVIYMVKVGFDGDFRFDVSVVSGLGIKLFSSVSVV